ncbi:hypothetical protein AAF712_008343 [Marasmius tenuissimus]|uniref:F-box domain-containing protein n=1 Tax=Marasmius tenuissimus TaxID=585030 RepID=A0ABR2ZTL2_9AGAR
MPLLLQRDNREKRQIQLCQHCCMLFQQMLHPPPPTNAYRNPMVYQHDRLTEEARIRDDITSLQAYDDQLLKIDVVRDQLIAHRAEARRRIQCRQHLLSSFRKIPPEIWEQIFFTFCFSDDETNLRDGQYYPHLLYPIQISEHRHMKPYMLSQVCFHWRNIVNQCHALWTRISIDLSLFLPSGDAPLQKQALRTLRVISERSGRLPLELRLESYALDEDRSYFAVTPSLRRAFKEAFSRTQYLDATIDIFAKSISAEPLHSLFSAAPSSRTMEISASPPRPIHKRPSSDPSQSPTITVYFDHNSSLGRWDITLPLATSNELHLLRHSHEVGPRASSSHLPDTA